jgi:Helix-hairpin-helix motif
LDHARLSRPAHLELYRWLAIYLALSWIILLLFPGSRRFGFQFGLMILSLVLLVSGALVYGRIRRLHTATETSLPDLLGPAKNSLIVAVNTASAKELESLSNIGSSRAEQIIAHRPYASVDELQVKGVTPRVIDQLRPFVKTDGETEKVKSSERQ